MSVNFTGAWSANLSKSRFLGPLPKAISVRIEHSGPELREEILVTKVDGSEERAVFKCSINSQQDKSMLNDREIRGGASWEGEELVIVSWVEFGATEMHFCDCWSLSQDGQTLSMEHRQGHLAGQRLVLSLNRTSTNLSATCQSRCGE